MEKIIIALVLVLSTISSFGQSIEELQRRLMIGFEETYFEIGYANYAPSVKFEYSQDDEMKRVFDLADKYVKYCKENNVSKVDKKIPNTLTTVFGQSCEVVFTYESYGKSTYLYFTERDEDLRYTGSCGIFCSQNFTLTFLQEYQKGMKLIALRQATKAEKASQALRMSQVAKDMDVIK